MADSRLRIPGSAQGTARNLNTVARLAAMAAELLDLVRQAVDQPVVVAAFTDGDLQCAARPNSPSLPESGTTTTLSCGVPRVINRCAAG